MVREMMTSKEALEQLCYFQGPQDVSKCLERAFTGVMLLGGGAFATCMSLGTGAEAADSLSDGSVSSALISYAGAGFAGAMSLGLIGMAGYSLFDGATSLVHPGMRNKGQYAFRNGGYIRDPRSIEIMMGMRVIPIDTPEGMESPNAYFMNNVRVKVLDRKLSETEFKDSDGRYTRSIFDSTTSATGKLNGVSFNFVKNQTYDGYPGREDIPSSYEPKYLLVKPCREGLSLVDMGNAMLRP